MKIDAARLRELIKSRGLTNTKLAAEAGITRQALQTMLRANHVVDVRDRTVKGLAHALRLPDESLLSPDPLVGYREAVADEHADLTFRGLGLPTTDPMSMDDLYVAIRVVRRPDEERECDCQPRKAAADNRPIQEPDELEVDGCLDRHRRVLIQGEPGSGKTTALRHVAGTYAKQCNSNGRHSKQARIPLLVRLADFAKARERDGKMTLVRFVVTRTLRDASPDYQVQVEHHLNLELQRGACVVLLDGLDEVGGNGDFPGELQRFIREFGGNRFVLSSRIVGLNPGPWKHLDFATFQVAGWREPEIRAFAERWYAGRPEGGRKASRKQVSQRAEQFATAILEHDSLREIASNPLMLTILAALHHANAALPRRRIDLYAKIVEVMLETWEASKREARPGDPLHGVLLEAREFGWLLARLALRMQREGRVLRPRWWMNDFVQGFLQDQLALAGDPVKEQSAQVVRYLCERTGLLAERGIDVFGFCHRTFQEYFAARGLLLEVEDGGDLVALLRPYIFHPQWEEVVVHVAALLSAPRATTLLRVILDDPDPAGRFLRRGQRLGLRCLADGAAVADRAVLAQLFSDGLVIGASRWLGTTIEFHRLLKQLRGTRHKAEAERLLTEIEEAEKRSLSDGDYLFVYSLSHELPPGPKDGVPGQICHKRLGGRQVDLVWPAWDMRIKEPAAWLTRALKSVRSSGTEHKSRMVLISMLGQEADESEQARRALKELLARDPLPAIRAECAEALEEAAPSDSTVIALLLDRLDKDPAELVRQRCAESLRSVAPAESEVRERLEELFASGPERVRAGAARGLSRLDFAAPEQQPLLERFLTTIASSAEPARVRRASIWALASLCGQGGLGSVGKMLEERLDDPDPLVSSAALHVLADAVPKEGNGWSQALLAKIETMLMAVDHPCPRLYSDLTKIVALKERHGGQRLERLLENALTPFDSAIRFAFVFGSVARVEQVRDSDIDLMVIGNIRLKELAAALHTPEQTLGRAVNPVLFSPEKFREQYREGNPFLLDVVRKEKIFLKGTGDELTALVADRSPDHA